MTRTTPPTGRHRAPRRRRWVWALGVALVAAVATAVVGSGSTYALWNDSAETDGVTIQSGTATLAVTPMDVRDPAPLAPGSSTTGTFTVRNSGTVPLSVRLALTGTKVSYAPSVPAAAVLDELTVRLSAVARATDCRAGLGGYGARPTAFDTGSGYYTLPVGITGTACVEVVLDADAPQTVAGAVTDFTLTVTGTQVTG
jgi:predicted ribosomally synthesized peptide with SipW-like signal peptide